MIIHKQIGYREMPKLSHRKIDLLINDIMSREGERKTKRMVNDKNDFKKWIMPEEPTGYLRGRKNDPL